MKKALLFLLFILSSSAFGQSITLFNVDASGFPRMKANFFAFDASGKQITNLSNSDLNLLEDGVQKNIISISCPPLSTIQNLSVAMSIDVSGSMSSSNFGNIPVELGKTTATELCNLINMPPSEFALQTCNSVAMIYQDFTTNKNKILNSIPSIVAGGGNDFKEQLLDEIAGLLNIAKRGEYNKVTVLYTDAWWYALTPQELQNCIDICSTYKIRFFAVIYSELGVEPNGIKKSLQALADATGGILYDGVTGKTAAIDIANRLQAISQGGDPCTIEWQSGAGCQTGKKSVELQLLGPVATSAFASYPAPSSAIASLEFNPAFVNFKNMPIGVRKDTIITITARNADFNVKNITTNYQIFSISPKTFKLNKNDSVRLTISYTPKDSNYVLNKFEFSTDNCASNYFSSGIYTKYKIKPNSLKLTRPNGGEKFVVGSDESITWEGVMPSDSPELDFSIDAGKTWKNIANNATNFKYNWNNIPAPASVKCLVKVTKNNTIPPIEWQKCLGGTDFDCGRSIQQTSDGGYIVAGETSSNDGDVKSYLGGKSDAWVVKLNPLGVIVWQKCFGGTGVDNANSIQETSDGGYIFAGYTASIDGDVKGYHTNLDTTDAWVVKLSPSGAVKWQKCLGGTGDDKAYSILQTKDGGYIVAGKTNSRSDDVKGFHGGASDAWIVKLSSSGDIIWQKCLGGTGDDLAHSIQETNDGEYIVAGETNSIDGDLKGVHGGNPGEAPDAWVVKLNTLGVIERQQCFGGTGEDLLTSVRQTNDGGYLVSGSTNSIDYDVKGFHGGSSDAWVVKFNTLGAIELQKCLGGDYDEVANSIQETSDGGYIVAGYTFSNDGDVIGHNPGFNYDAWVVKLTPSGEIAWQKCLGGNSQDVANSIQESSDGGYIVAGYTFSNDGDVKEHQPGSSYDAWVVKLGPDGSYQSDLSDAVFSIVAPLVKAQNIDMKQCLLGSVKESVITNFVQNVGSYKCRIDSIYFRGPDAGAFSIVSGLPKYEILSGAAKATEFRFTPNRIGIHSAEIVIITQAATLTQTISGEGVQALLSIANKVIDFGVVKVGGHKDTIEALTIKNISGSTLNITSTKHAKPNATDFTTLVGGGPFSIAPGETHKMNLRFTASDVGLTNGTLEFEFNGPGSPAKILLLAKGVKSNPTIETFINAFNDLICTNTGTSELKISNTGADPIIIKELSFKGSNATEFTINGTVPVTIAQDSSKILTINFTPKTTGVKNVDLVIKSNANPDSLITISIVAKKDSVGLTPSLTTIDLGYLCPNEAKDTSLIVTNNGTIVTGGYAAASSNLTLTNNAFNIATGSNHTINVHFNGTANEGKFSEKITITDSLCGGSKEVNIIGEIALPIIIANRLEIISLIAGYKDGNIVISNPAKREVTITSIANIAAPFEVIGNPFPISIAPGVSAELPIRYTPNDNINDSINIVINAEPCAIANPVEVFGLTTLCSATLQILNYEAYQGDIIEVPIIMNSSRNLEASGAGSLKVDLSYNPTLLFPIGCNKQSINDSLSKITIDNLPTNKSIGDTLARVRFNVGLGNAETCDLELSNAEPVGNGTVDISLISGTFKLLGICRDGGTRLINPNSQAQILSVRPNPATNAINIEYQLTEKGGAEFLLINNLGETVKQIFYAEISDYSQRLETMKLDDLANGRYTLILKTPTISERRSVLVVR